MPALAGFLARTLWLATWRGASATEGTIVAGKRSSRPSWMLPRLSWPGPLDRRPFLTGSHPLFPLLPTSNAPRLRPAICSPDHLERTLNKNASFTALNSICLLFHILPKAGQVGVYSTYGRLPLQLLTKQKCVAWRWPQAGADLQWFQDKEQDK